MTAHAAEHASRAGPATVSAVGRRSIAHVRRRADEDDIEDRPESGALARAATTAARIGIPSRMLTVPIWRPVWSAMPWWSASHRPEPQAGLDHQADPDAEQDQAQEQARQSRQGRSQIEPAHASDGRIAAPQVRERAARRSAGHRAGRAAGPPATATRPARRAARRTNGYQPGSPSHHGPRSSRHPSPDGCRDDRRQRVVRHVAGRLDELPTNGPPRPLRVGDDAQTVVGDLGPDVVRAAVRVVVELDLEQRPADVEHHGAVPVQERLARIRRRRRASAAARPVRSRPSPGCRPCASRNAADDDRVFRERRARRAGRPRRGRARSRGGAPARLPTPPSAYVAKTQGGRTRQPVSLPGPPAARSRS